MKLTQYHKDNIQSKVVAKKFDPLYAKMLEKDQAFGQKLYDAIPGIAVLATGLNAQVQAGWFFTSASIRASFDGWQKYIALPTELPHPHYITRDGGLRFAQGTPEYIEFKALEHERRALDDAKFELKAEIAKVLKGITTSNKLQEIWPEAAEHLPTAPPPVPAVLSIDRLKELLK